MVRLLAALLLLLPMTASCGVPIWLRTTEPHGATQPRAERMVKYTPHARLAGLYHKKYAVVAGINRYPRASRDFGALTGAVNDAKRVAEKLRELGFEVTTLLDEATTKSAIVSALGD